jgi:glutamate dehydrogenase
MMENLGLRVLSEHPYEMKLAGSSIYIQDFEVEAEDASFDLEQVKEAFQQAFERIWRGGAENDRFNRLILARSSTGARSPVLRGYCKYLLQTGVPFSQSYMEATLDRYRCTRACWWSCSRPSSIRARNAEPHPGRGGTKAPAARSRAADAEELRRTNAGVYEALLHARGEERQQQVNATHQMLRSLMDTVASLDEDRILRSFTAMIHATLRTNYWQHPDGKPRDYVVFKLDPAKVPDLPKPRPYREIFVCSPKVEGVHLRFGRSRAAACAGPTGARTSAPRCWAWSRRRW